MKLLPVTLAAAMSLGLNIPAFAQATIGIGVAGDPSGYSQMIHDAAQAGQINISIEGAMQDPAKQQDEVANWIAQGVGAIVLEPVDPMLVDQLKSKASDAGVPLVIVGKLAEAEGDEANSPAVDITSSAATVFSAAPDSDLEALMKLATAQIGQECPSPAPQALALAIAHGRTAADRLSCVDNGSEILSGVQQAIVLMDGGSHSGGYFAPASGGQFSGGALAPTWIGGQDTGGYVTPPEVSECTFECWPCGGGTGECCGLRCGF